MGCRPLPSIMEEVVVLDAPRKTTQEQSDSDSDGTCTYDSDAEVEDIRISNLSGQFDDDLAESYRSRARTVRHFCSKGVAPTCGEAWGRVDTTCSQMEACDGHGGTGE